MCCRGRGCPGAVWSWGGGHGGGSAQTPLRVLWDSSRSSTPALARGWEFFWHQPSDGNASVPGEGSGVNNASCCCVLPSGLGAGSASIPPRQGLCSPCRVADFSSSQPLQQRGLTMPVPSPGFVRLGARRKPPPCVKSQLSAGKAPLGHGAASCIMGPCRPRPTPQWASELLSGRNHVSADPMPGSCPHCTCEGVFSGCVEQGPPAGWVWHRWLLHAGCPRRIRPSPAPVAALSGTGTGREQVQRAACERCLGDHKLYQSLIHYGRTWSEIAVVSLFALLPLPSDSFPSFPAASALSRSFQFSPPFGSPGWAPRLRRAHPAPGCCGHRTGPQRRRRDGSLLSRPPWRGRDRGGSSRPGARRSKFWGADGFAA